ncbi:MAG: hypothetical protein CMG22_00690 [Candidatus Marinimicrobia bacterium]|nr:hypothetical protein [Candidatus Neomarinimicrobiota bacterium]
MKKIILFLAVIVNYPLSSQSQEDNFVNKVSFVGNGVLRKSDLSNQLELKPSSLSLFSKPTFDRRLLKLDAISIKNYYHSQGFLEVAVKDSFSISNDGVDVFFVIEEGNRYLLNDVKFNGLKSIKEKSVRSILGLKQGAPYNPVRINTNLTLVDEEYQEKGKLYVKFDIQQEIKDSVNIIINIDEGDDIYINKSWVNGLERMDSSYVLNEIAFNEGDLFNKSLMDKTKRNLLQTGFFSSASLVTHPANVDTLVNIEVRIREFQNRGTQDIEFGYTDIEAVPGITSLVGLGGSVRWSDRMILGTNNRFDATGSMVMPTETGFIYPRLNSEIKFSNQRPFKMKTPIQMKLFFQQFKNYGDESGPYVRRFGLQYSNIFRWNRQRSFLDIGARFELFDKSEEFTNQIEQRKFKIHLHQDNRDNPIYPQKGNVLVFQLNSFGGVLGGNRTYNKYDIDLRQYVSPLKKITVAGRINVGMISGWKADYDKDDSVEIEKVLYEKFYLGGSNTLRGLRPLRFFTHATDNVDNNNDGIVDDPDESDKIPSGKTAKFLTNWEIRFPLFWKVGAVLFYDGGSISNDLTAIKPSDLRWNRGVGITINLPIGPIRIDYGEDLNDPSIKQFHFGLLYAF